MIKFELSGEILSPSPIFRPYIEYYNNLVINAEGTFKCIPGTNEELYFNYKKHTCNREPVMTLIIRMFVSEAYTVMNKMFFQL